MKVLISVILGVVIFSLFSFEKRLSQFDINGKWNVDNIQLNNVEDSVSEAKVLGFLKKSNPTIIVFEINDGKGVYSIFSGDKLLENAIVTVKGNSLCRKGVDDCAQLVLNGNSCKLIFSKFTYYLSQ